VDVIVTSTTPAIQAVKQSTTTIPIVAISADPVGTGIAASLARPGGNVTGLSVLGPEMSGKQLELLTETLPSVKRVAFVRDPANPALPLRFKESAQRVTAAGTAARDDAVRWRWHGGAAADEILIGDRFTDHGVEWEVLTHPPRCPAGRTCALASRRPQPARW
jgi:hypothetical protein